MVELTGEELSEYHDLSITNLQISGGKSFKRLERFVYLTYLDCFNTNISEIPKELVNLTRLDCYNTNITEIPKELVNLTTLHCRYTKITEIPKELVNLTQLYCHGTKITEIPKELVNLTILDCGITKITEIPKELVNLTILDCGITKISEIPKELVNLTELYCSNTKITEIPKELVNLDNKTDVDEYLNENKYRIEFLKLKKKLILNNTLSDIPTKLKELIKTNKYYESFEEKEIGKVFMMIKRLKLDLPKDLVNILCDYL
jgi:Leucine-rich repeat (LRR) protein